MGCSAASLQPVCYTAARRKLQIRQDYQCRDRMIVPMPYSEVVVLASLVVPVSHERVPLMQQCVLQSLI